MRKKNLDIEIQCVCVQHFKSWMNEALAQKTGETCVFLDRENTRAFLKRQLC